jgi:hypothetical protein
MINLNNLTPCVDLIRVLGHLGEGSSAIRFDNDNITTAYWRRITLHYMHTIALGSLGIYDTQLPSYR